jgi:hypothetical protein
MIVVYAHQYHRPLCVGPTTPHLTRPQVSSPALTCFLSSVLPPFSASVM